MAEFPLNYLIGLLCSTREGDFYILRRRQPSSAAAAVNPSLGPEAAVTPKDPDGRASWV